MYTQKNEKIICRWLYRSQNGYDGFDWVDINTTAALCEDTEGRQHLYLDCYDDSARNVLITACDVGFNPLFYMLGLDECIKDVIYEHCLALEIELASKCNYYDQLDELEQLEVRMNIIKYMRDVVSAKQPFMIHQYTGDEKIPFNVWISKDL